jgi:dephospho-CoA kinase
MKRILITGMSGAGKSTVIARLAELGHATVETDRPPYCHWVETANGPEWMWNEPEIERLLAREYRGFDRLFLNGCESNQGRFYDRLDAVILLSAPVEVIMDRIATRTTNDWGKALAERDLIREQIREIEPLIRSTCTHEIRTDRPLEDVVRDVLAVTG